MINFHYLECYGRYALLVKNFIPNSPDITFKFDTGASYSTINVSSLFSNQEFVERTALYVKELIENGVCVFGSFPTALGDSETGILCCVPNFRLSEDSPVFDFYFYLITSLACRKASIGVDFISCCDVSCAVGADTIVEEFYVSEYEKSLGSQEKEKAIYVDDLFQEIQEASFVDWYRRVKEHLGTTTLKDFIDRLNESGSLDFIDSENLVFIETESASADNAENSGSTGSDDSRGSGSTGSSDNHASPVNAFL